MAQFKLSQNNLPTVIDQATDAVAVLAIGAMAISGAAPNAAIWAVVSIALGKKVIAK